MVLVISFPISLKALWTISLDKICRLDLYFVIWMLIMMMVGLWVYAQSSGSFFVDTTPIRILNDFIYNILMDMILCYKVSLV